jgi:hypothetical protein
MASPNAAPPSAKKAPVAEEVWEVLKECVVTPAQEVMKELADVQAKRKRCAGVLSTMVGVVVTQELTDMCQQELVRKVRMHTGCRGQEDKVERGRGKALRGSHG